MSHCAGPSSSPTSIEAAYTERALAAWRAVVADFNRHYETACLRRQCPGAAQERNSKDTSSSCTTTTPAPGAEPPIRGLHLDRNFWASIEDFNSAAGLYLELVHGDPTPRERARCMNRRTLSQRNAQESVLRVPAIWTGASGELGSYTTNRCGNFPLSKAQHKEVAKACYYAVDEMRELVAAVIDYNRAELAYHQAREQQQDAAERHRLWEAAGKAARYCERVAHLPLYLMLDDARDRLCSGMGFDPEEVPKSFRMTPLLTEAYYYDEDDDTVEEESERVGVCDETTQPGTNQLGPRRLAVKIRSTQAEFAALRLSLAVNLRLGFFPTRTVLALERMMEMLEEMVVWTTYDSAISASSRGRLADLLDEVVGLLEKTAKSRPEILMLLDARDPNYQRRRRGSNWRLRTKCFFKRSLASSLASGPR